jgi:hypothetical protein
LFRINICRIVITVLLPVLLLLVFFVVVTITQGMGSLLTWPGCDSTAHSRKRCRGRAPGNRTSKPNGCVKMAIFMGTYCKK